SVMQPTSPRCCRQHGPRSIVRMRLVVFDATDVGFGVVRAREPSFDGTARAHVGLAPIWMAGARLHRGGGAADAWLGARSWDEALAWAADVATKRDRAIRSLQFWGHGGWGVMWLGGDRLDASALGREHRLAPRLDAV